MYRQSFFLVVLVLLFTGLLATGTRFVAAIPGVTGLPSSYDPKISVEEAAETSTKPLLIEFYTDSCHTCQIITPWVHKLSQKYENDLTFVMVDVNNAKNTQVAQIFGIEFVPAIFIFDFKHMTKAQIDVGDYRNLGALDKAIEKASQKVQRDAKAKAGKS